LVKAAFETLLLKSARSKCYTKWAQIDQHTKALRLSHRAGLFIFGRRIFAQSGPPLGARAQLKLSVYRAPLCTLNRSPSALLVLVIQDPGKFSYGTNYKHQC
jgi:hypothetical protein